MSTLGAEILQSGTLRDTVTCPDGNSVARCFLSLDVAILPFFIHSFLTRCAFGPHEPLPSSLETIQMLILIPSF